VRIEGLADTGALLAFLDADDKWHGRCVAAFERLRLPLGTTAAVLAELFHLLGGDARGVSAAWRLLRSDAIAVLPVVDDDLPALEELMQRYADRPMDFADATLVNEANRTGVSTVFTIDHADFLAYRIHRRRRFRIVPDPG
jgi:predicted nucleic acid-binding protein